MAKAGTEAAMRRYPPRVLVDGFLSEEIQSEQRTMFDRTSQPEFEVVFHSVENYWSRSGEGALGRKTDQSPLAPRAIA